MPGRKIADPRRLAISIILATTLAILAGLQAISSVTVRRAPELSTSLMPSNGIAREQLAYLEFSSRVTDPLDTQAAAKAASEHALRALGTNPLAPKAYAILAMAQPNQASRKDILALASRLNRRDLILQSLWLNEKLEERNFSETVEALDRILRVNPQHQDQLYPVLGEALENEETIPEFIEILNGASPWHMRFLGYAARQTQLQPNLAQLRMKMNTELENIDRSLMLGLVRQGRYVEAYELYSHISAIRPQEIGSAMGPWRSTYPPFDWYLADEAGFRAQQSLDAQSLELSVRPGKGGVIAERFIKAPDGPIRIRISHRILPNEQLRDVRLQANCAGSGAPYFDEKFESGALAFDLPRAPQGCEFVSLVINARAWSGRSSLSGSINSFVIEAAS